MKKENYEKIKEALADEFGMNEAGTNELTRILVEAAEQAVKKFGTVMIQIAGEGKEDLR